MKRIFALIAVLLPIVAFAHSVAAIGSVLVAERMAQDDGTIVLTENLDDRCLMAASCSLPCTMCAAVLFRQSASLPDYGTNWADFNPTLVTPTLAERPYQPTKPDRLRSLSL